MLIKKIKNNSDNTQIWCGQQINVGEYYEIQALEEVRWANDSILLSAIGSEDAIVNNGSVDILDINSAINYLKGNIITEVITQFEKDNKILKLFCAKADVDGNSEATIEIKIPGVLSNGEGRYVAGGKAWFSSATEGDQITVCEVVDKDNVLGYGANIILKKWHDDEASSINQGWYFPIHNPILEVQPIGGYGFILSQLYLRIKGKKAGSITSGTLYINLFWASEE